MTHFQHHSDVNETRLRIVYLQLLCAMLFFGLSFVFTALALQELRPITIIVARLVISVSALLILARIPAVTAIVGTWQKPRVEDYKIFLQTALFQPFIYFLCENTGLLYAGPAVVAIIIATIPVITPLFTFFLLQEKISIYTVFGALLSMGGVTLIVLAGGEEGGAHPMGVALVFGAVLAAVGYSITVRRIPNRYSSLTVVAWQNLLGLSLLLPLMIIFDGKHLLQINLPSMQISGALLFLGIFPSTVSFIFFSRGIRILGTVKANITTNTVPVFATLFSILVLNEPFRIITFIGMTIVISGVFIGTWFKQKTGQNIHSAQYIKS